MVEEVAPDVRVINLETNVTRSADFAPGKAVHYRMNPDNLPCVAAIRPDVYALANNHVLDFGERGCGDRIDDYEGITGYEEYRDDLGLLYFASIAPGTGELAVPAMVPMQARNMRLRHASTADSRWLAATLGQRCCSAGSSWRVAR